MGAIRDLREASEAALSEGAEAKQKDTEDSLYFHGGAPDPPDSEMHSDPWEGVRGRVAVGPALPSLEQQKRMKNHPLRGWSSWTPILIGLILAAFASDLRNLAMLWEPWGMRLLFPYVLLAGKSEMGLSAELTRTLPQMMLWLQFPLEGLLTRLSLGRGVQITGALGQILFLRLVGALVLYLISGSMVTP